MSSPACSPICPVGAPSSPAGAAHRSRGGGWGMKNNRYQTRVPSVGGAGSSSGRLGARGVLLLARRASATSVAGVEDVTEAPTDPYEGVDTNGVALDAFERFVMEMQASVCADMEALDGKDGARFSTDAWTREGRGSGFGVTRVLEGGDLFEKAAANVSIIRGVLTPERARAMSSRGRDVVDPAGGQPYSAAALSLVFHPRSPMVPTFRADIRRFTVGGVSWFGGGADLTPYYLYEEDAAAFHEHWKAVCDAHDPSVPLPVEVKEAGFFARLFGGKPAGDGAAEADAEAATAAGGPLYARCKEWCDEYFYIPARKEHRGVGGIFFDDMASDPPAEAPSSEDGVVPTAVTTPAVARDAEAFTRAVALNWTASYAPIVGRRRDDAFGEEEERWHHQRRGRYVEFNLLYDRGVKFGLDGGRVESIMVSAPPRVRWDYDVVPPAGSREEKLVEVLRNPKNW